jgi:hypothetical protein
LVVDGPIELDPSNIHIYHTIKIKKGGTLSVSSNVLLTLTTEVLEIELVVALIYKGRDTMEGPKLSISLSTTSTLIIFQASKTFANRGCSLLCKFTTVPPSNHWEEGMGL